MPALFVSSGIFTYAGAALAVGLFALMAPLGVVWWRMAVGAGVLWLLWRPWKQSWSLKSLALAVAFGVVLATMNALFYEAIARIPMGTAVSVEFTGPVFVAVLTGRGWRPRLAALLALGGVGAIGGFGLALSDPVVFQGFLYILAAAAAWAGYILLGAHISKSSPTGPSLAIGLGAAALIYLPLFYSSAFHVRFTPGILLALAGVAVLSTALPYSIDAVAFGRLSADTFALLTALLPATSVVVGAVMLRQIPNMFEIVGLVLVSTAVWLAGKQPHATRYPERRDEGEALG